MTIEHARARALAKPWGILDLRPWSNAFHDAGPIGEIWYERPGRAAADSALLPKMLFTNQALSIQVHPDDAFAHSIGLPRQDRGLVRLERCSRAKVARSESASDAATIMRAIDDGSISDLVVWRDVAPGDVIFVPAGTIHAIGAGLVIAEIQQRSDATFRLSTTVGSVIFISKAPSRWRTLGQPIFRYNRIDSPTSGRFSFPVRTSFSNGSSWRRIPRGRWKRNKRPGCSLSEAVPAPDRSTMLQVTPFSRSRIASIFTPVRPAWWASQRTLAAARFRTCCNASDSWAQ